MDNVVERLGALATLQYIDSKLDKILTLRGSLPDEVDEIEFEIQGLENKMDKINGDIAGLEDFKGDAGGDHGSVLNCVSCLLHRRICETNS